MNKNIATKIIDKDKTNRLKYYFTEDPSRHVFLSGSHQPHKEYRHMRLPTNRVNWSNYHVDFFGKFCAPFPYDDFMSLKTEIIDSFNLDTSRMKLTEVAFGDMVSQSIGKYSCHFHQDPNLSEDWLHVRLNILLTRPEIGGYQVVYDNPIGSYPDEQIPRTYHVEINQPWAMVAGMFPHGTSSMTSISDKTPRTIISYGTYIHIDYLNELGWVTYDQLNNNRENLIPIGAPGTLLTDQLMDSFHGDFNVVDNQTVPEYATVSLEEWNQQCAARLKQLQDVYYNL